MRWMVAMAGVLLLAVCDRPADGASASPGDASESAPVEPEDMGPQLSTEITIDGDLSQPQVEQVAGENFDAVQECFNEAMSRMEMDDTSGVIRVEMTIDKAGAVTVAQLDASSFGDSIAESCIVDTARAWTFPRLRKGATATVVYPFQLRSY